MDDIGAVSELVLESKRVVIFTGAGISTESDIPDFCSPGEIWDRFDPTEFTYQKFLSSEASREKFWQFYKYFRACIVDARPNRGHLAIAELYSMGKLDCVITQNVDNLHQESGIPEEKVIELNGTLKWTMCLSCGERYHKEQVQRRLEAGEKVIRCRCNGIMKPTIVIFGQSCPEKETQEAREKALNCDVFIVAGSSLVEYPAAQIPLIAKDSGAKLVIINLMATPQDPYADIIIHGKPGDTLFRIVSRVKAELKS